MAYTIREGDTVTELATRLGITAHQLMSYKHLFSTPGDARTLKIGGVVDLDVKTTYDPNQPDLGEEPPRGGPEGGCTGGGPSGGAGGSGRRRG